MKYIELNQLMEIALEQKEEWHFHLLPLDCIFTDSAIYKVILETKGQNYSAEVDYNPLEELQKLESHFYKRDSGSA